MLPPLKKKNNMGQCEKCLESNWAFEFAGGMVTATCKYCDNVIQFESKKSKKFNRRGPKQYPASKLAPVNLHHRYVPSGEPERPANVMPWD